MKKLPSCKNPLLNGEQGLNFDNDEVFEMSEKDVMNEFMSRWISTVRPFRKYREIIQMEDEKVLFHLVKNYYRKYVINGDWSERKYVMVLDDVLCSKYRLSDKTLERSEERFNNGDLSAQRAEKRKKRGRI